MKHRLRSSRQEPRKFSESAASPLARVDLEGVTVGVRVGARATPRLRARVRRERSLLPSTSSLLIPAPYLGLHGEA